MSKIIRRKTLTKVVGLMIIALSCMILYLFIDGTYLLNQPCRPLRYPDSSELKKTYQAEFMTTDDPLENIIQFYQQRLNPEPAYAEYYFEGDHNIWTEQHLVDQGAIYRCIGKQSNGVLVRGCIYVYKSEERHLIEMIRYESTEGLMNCRQSLRP